MEFSGYLFDGPLPGDILTSFLKKFGMDVNSGGHSFFLGQVRADNLEGKAVRAIEYSAYGPMVENEAERIKKQVLREFPDVRSLHILHSRGIVKSGEISLLVAVSAGHRQQAMQACSKTVELVKEFLPVWKKEIFDDDSYTWKV
jgi:molybdopterin synthase catalytic subunit